MAGRALGDLPYGGESLHGSGSQGFAARIWDINQNCYTRLADVWPLNPAGELMLGRHDHVAQWPVLLSRSAGAARHRIQHAVQYRAAEARLRVAAACKASGVRLLDTCIPETVADSIKLGGMVLECSGQSALGYE